MPDDLPPDLACLLACGVITGVGAVVNARGSGRAPASRWWAPAGVGLNAVQGAALAGAGRIVAVDVSAAKLAARAGVRGDRRGWRRRVPARRSAALTGGRGVDSRSSRWVAGGDRRGGGVSRGGRDAGGGGDAGVGERGGYDPTTLAAMNQRIIGARMGRAVLARDIPWLIGHWRAGRLKLAELVSGRYALEEINAAIAATRAGAARRNVSFRRLKLRDLEVLVVGNPPPGFGGRYFIFVKLVTDDGVVGWGEVYAASVGPEAMRAVIADVFARHMAGESPENVELMFRRAYSAGFSQRPDPTVMGAFSGLEIACWDILGKARGRPVHALWGGRLRERLRSYTYLYPGPGEDPAGFYNDPDASAACAARMVEVGFTAVKFDPAGPYTIHGGHQPTLADLDRSEAFCRRCAGRWGTGRTCCSGRTGSSRRRGRSGWRGGSRPTTPCGSRSRSRRTRRSTSRGWRRRSTVPIAGGERLTTKAEFATVLRAGGVGVLQPSLGRVGGLLEARKVAVMAEGFGVQVAPHLYAGPIAWAAAIQLGLSIPNFLILETIGTGGGFHAELLTRPIALGGGLRAGAGGAGARGGDRRGGGAGASLGGRAAAPGDEPGAARAGGAAVRRRVSGRARTLLQDAQFFRYTY